MLKSNHNQLLAEITLLEDLANELKNAPDEAINFHLSDGNDFAQWIGSVLGDKKLAKQVTEIEVEEGQAPKDQLVSLIELRIQQLK